MKWDLIVRVVASLAVILMLSAEPATGQLCRNKSVGFPPITDLGTQFWRGAQGGLYPDGQNARPFEHNQNGIELASQVGPLDALGNPDPVNGKIVFLSVGMSNAEQEFGRLEIELFKRPDKNPSVVLINGAQGGWPIDDIISSNSPYWDNILTMLSEHGVTYRQVEVIWFKEADAHPGETAPDTTFNGYVDSLKEKFKTAAAIVRSKFPNAVLCYVASRIYGGYDETLGNPEPFAYYQGWAVKYLIEDQINGDTSLTYLGPHAKAPWLSWGTYLWADGINARNDSLRWICPDDFEADGKHPSEEGEHKVAAMVLDSLMEDPTAAPWLFSGTTDVPPGSSGNIPAGFSVKNYPNPFNPSTTIEFELPAQGHVQLTVYNTLGEEVESLLHQEMPAGIHRARFIPERIGTGMYFYILRADSRLATGKMIFLK